MDLSWLLGMHRLVSLLLNERSEVGAGVTVEGSSRPCGSLPRPSVLVLWLPVRERPVSAGRVECIRSVYDCRSPMMERGDNMKIIFHCHGFSTVTLYTDSTVYTAVGQRHASKSNVLTYTVYPRDREVNSHTHHSSHCNPGRTTDKVSFLRAARDSYVCTITRTELRGRGELFSAHQGDGRAGPHTKQSPEKCCCWPLAPNFFPSAVPFSYIRYHKYNLSPAPCTRTVN